MFAHAVTSSPTVSTLLLRLMMLLLVASALAPGNPMFGLRESDYARLNIVEAEDGLFCADYRIVCQFGARLHRGVGAQTAFIFDSVYAWVNEGDRETG